MARKAIGKKLRFEVFKRDGFKCQYCGAEAPKVVLHVDHIHPVSKGGDNDLMNLVTCCEGCNSGKSNRTLSDDSAVAKQRAQLEDLNERREQMEMMLKWRDGLKAMKVDQEQVIRDKFRELVPGFRINDDSKVPKEWLRKYALPAILDAMELAAERYLKTDAEGDLVKESVEEVMKKAGGILRIESMEPDKKRLYYIRGILRNRLYHVGPDVLRMMENALDAGVAVDDIEEAAKTERNWSGFRDWLYQAMQDARE